MNLVPIDIHSAEYIGHKAAAWQDQDSKKLIPIVSPIGKPCLQKHLAITSTTFADLVPAPGAGNRLRIWGIAYSNIEATTKAPQVRFGTGTPFFPIPVTTTIGYVFCPLPDGSFIEGGENEALQAALATGTATGSNVNVYAVYTIEPINQ